MPYLMLLNAQNIPGEEWELGSDPLTVGRGEVTEIQLSDPRLSRQHFRVCNLDGAYVLEDLGSTGGTFLNDEPVTNALLKPGDLIRAGGSRFYFDVGMDTMLNVSADQFDVGNESMVGSFIKDLREDKK